MARDEQQRDILDFAECLIVWRLFCQYVEQRDDLTPGDKLTFIRVAAATIAWQKTVDALSTNQLGGAAAIRAIGRHPDIIQRTGKGGRGRQSLTGIHPNLLAQLRSEAGTVLERFKRKARPKDFGPASFNLLDVFCDRWSSYRHGDYIPDDKDRAAARRLSKYITNEKNLRRLLGEFLRDPDPYIFSRGYTLLDFAARWRKYIPAVDMIEQREAGVIDPADQLEMNESMVIENPDPLSGITDKTTTNNQGLTPNTLIPPCANPDNFAQPSSIPSLTTPTNNIISHRLMGISQ